MAYWNVFSEEVNAVVERVRDSKNNRNVHEALMREASKSYKDQALVYLAFYREDKWRKEHEVKKTNEFHSRIEALEDEVQHYRNTAQHYKNIAEELTKEVKENK